MDTTWTKRRWSNTSFPTIPNHPEWRKHYNLFTNHWAAVTVVAEDLSKHCDLDVYADSIWIGGGTMGLGMVFKGVSMGKKSAPLKTTRS